MVIAALAWNIKSWVAMIMHRKQDRRDYLRMEFRRFLTSIILIPAMVCRRACGITVRIIGYTPAWTGCSAPGTPPNEPASADPQRIPDPGPTTPPTRGDLACPQHRESAPTSGPHRPTPSIDAADTHPDPPDHTASPPRPASRMIIHANDRQRLRTRLFEG